MASAKVADVVIPVFHGILAGNDGGSGLEVVFDQPEVNLSAQCRLKQGAESNR
jgi:hypothetical protein